MKQITINHWMLGEILAPKLTCRAKIVCTCICGTIKHITWDNIKSNRSKSCGCAFGLTKTITGRTGTSVSGRWACSQSCTLATSLRAWRLGLPSLLSNMAVNDPHRLRRRCHFSPWPMICPSCALSVSTKRPTEETSTWSTGSR